MAKALYTAVGVICICTALAVSGCVSGGQRAVIAKQGERLRAYVQGAQAIITTDPRLPTDVRVAGSVVAEDLLERQETMEGW